MKLSFECLILLTLYLCINLCFADLDEVDNAVTATINGDPSASAWISRFTLISVDEIMKENDIPESSAWDVSRYATMDAATINDLPNPDSEKCDRNYDKMCPQGWSEDITYCLPPEGYLGTCTGKQDMSLLTPLTKRDFESRCGAKWPCMAECYQRYDVSCPVGWTVDGMGWCVQPPSYNGPCSVKRKAPKAFNLQLYTPSMKKSWAAYCQVNFPCKQNCKPDFTIECPKFWRKVDGQCVAPSTYQGGCDKAISMNRFSKGMKMAFTVQCQVQWPCDDRGRYDLTKPCPLGWEYSTSDDLCRPHPTYRGPKECTSGFAPSSLSYSERFQWGRDCNAPWPPLQNCIREYTLPCPDTWTFDTNVKSCVAPPAYAGKCARVMKFSSWNSPMKTAFEAACGAVWPCDAASTQARLNDLLKSIQEGLGVNDNKDHGSVDDLTGVIVVPGQPLPDMNAIINAFNSAKEKVGASELPAEQTASSFLQTTSTSRRLRKSLRTANEATEDIFPTGQVISNGVVNHGGSTSNESSLSKIVPLQSPVYTSILPTESTTSLPLSYTSFAQTISLSDYLNQGGYSLPAHPFQLVPQASDLDIKALRFREAVRSGYDLFDGGHVSSLCERDYLAPCPIDWIPYKNYCLAAPGYLGKCNRIQSFAGLVDRGERKVWAEECEAEWPCVKCEHDYEGQICPMGWHLLPNGFCRKQPITSIDRNFDRKKTVKLIANNDEVEEKAEKEEDNEAKEKQENPKENTDSSKEKPDSSKEKPDSSKEKENKKSDKGESKPSDSATITTTAVTNKKMPQRANQESSQVLLGPVSSPMERCLTTMDFRKMSVRQKRFYSQMCGYDWPCRRSCEPDVSRLCPVDWIKVDINANLTSENQKIEEQVVSQHLQTIANDTSTNTSQNQVFNFPIKSILLPSAPPVYCSPIEPLTYKGNCTIPLRLPDNPHARIALADLCDFEWGCLTSCPQRVYDARCPIDWAFNVTESACVAPQTYIGPCPRLQSFLEWSDAGKKEWSSGCGADWPCSGFKVESGSSAAELEKVNKTGTQKYMQDQKEVPSPTFIPFEAYNSSYVQANYYEFLDKNKTEMDAIKKTLLVNPCATGEGGGMLNFTQPCPINWKPLKGTVNRGICLPPKDYEGPCVRAPSLLRDYDGMMKAEFALKCHVEWPCAKLKTEAKGLLNMFTAELEATAAQKNLFYSKDQLAAQQEAMAGKSAIGMIFSTMWNARKNLSTVKEMARTKPELEDADDILGVPQRRNTVGEIIRSKYTASDPQFYKHVEEMAKKHKSSSSSTFSKIKQMLNIGSAVVKQKVDEASDEESDDAANQAPMPRTGIMGLPDDAPPTLTV